MVTHHELHQSGVRQGTTCRPARKAWATCAGRMTASCQLEGIFLGMMTPLPSTCSSRMSPEGEGWAVLPARAGRCLVREHFALAGPHPILPAGPVVQIFSPHVPDPEYSRAGFDPRKRQPSFARKSFVPGNSGQTRHRFAAPVNHDLTTFFNLRDVAG
jgi:hypothetical protein